MTAPVLLDPTRWWECPSCHHQHVTRDTRTISPMHQCPAHQGIDVPLVQVQNNHGLTGVRHVVRERGDYIGTEQGIRYDVDGKAIMGVDTERPDGTNDCVVFAPVATATGDT